MRAEKPKEYVKECTHKTDSVAGRLKQLRVNAKLTQEKVAMGINVSRESITKWEGPGNIIPRSADLIALADYYGVSCDYILRGVTPERLAIVRDLGLSDAAIQEMQSLKESSYRSYGLISELFDRQYGAISYILDCVDKAIDIRTLQIMEQKRFDLNGETDEPTLLTVHGAEVDYDIVIRAMVREASEAFMQNVYAYVNEEAKRNAEKENNS